MTPCLIFFSMTLPGSGDGYVHGAGGIAADGFPVPYDGYLTNIRVWDYTNSVRYGDHDEVTLSANQRLSIWASDQGADYEIRSAINGVTTTLKARNVPHNAIILVTLTFLQKFG